MVWLGDSSSVYYSVSSSTQSIQCNKVRNNNVVWRHQLLDEDIKSLINVGSNKLLVVSNHHSVYPIVRLYSTDGLLHWQYNHAAVPSNVKHNHHNLNISSDTVLYDSNVAVLSDDSIVSLNINTGSINWKYQSTRNILKLLYNSDTNNIVAVASGNNKLTLLVLDESGSVVSHELPSINAGFNKNTIAFVDNQYIVVADSSSNQLHVYNIYAVNNEQHKWLTIIEVSGMSSSESIVSVYSLQHNSNAVVLQLTHSKYVISINESANKLNVQQLYNTTSGIISGVSSGSFLHTMVNDDTVSVQHITTATQPVTVRQAVNVQIKLHNNDIVRVITPSNNYGTTAVPSKYLFVCSDYTTHYITDNTVRHTAHNSLAHIQHSVVAELPVATDLDVNVDADTVTFPNVIQRIPLQVKSLYHTAQHILQSISKVTQRIINQSGRAKRIDSDDTELNQDTFGFKQLLVVLTSTKQLYGINTLTGTIAWQHSLSHQYNVHKLFNAPHHTVALLLHDNTSNQYSLLYMSTTSGQPSKIIPLPYEVMSILPLIDTDILLSVDTQSNVHIIPDNDDSRSTLAELHRDVYFYKLAENNGSMVGYNIVRVNGVYKASIAYSFQLPSDEHISSTAARSSDDIMQSSVRVLHQGDILLQKYTDNNIVVIATTRNQANELALPALRGKSLEPSVSIYIINTLSGQLIEKIVHKQCSGPVHVTISENNIVSHMWDYTVNTYTLSTYELYQHHTFHKLDSSLVLKSFISGNQDSDTQPLNAYVLQQSYIFNYPITSMQFTHTQRGITARDAVVGLSNGMIYTIPKSILDPKRPLITAVTDKDKADGLYPYIGEIILDSKRVITTTHKIHNLHTILTVPSNLESTSIVIGIGSDIFQMRVTPSQTFDLLNPDFNYLFLLATVASICIGIQITKSMATSKELRNAWI